MYGPSEYELRIFRNIQENKKVLASLGLDNFKVSLPKSGQEVLRKPLQIRGVKRKRKDPNVEPITSDFMAAQGNGQGRKCHMRRSLRLKGQAPAECLQEEYRICEDKDDFIERPLKAPKNRQNVFGEIPGCPVGTTWSTRLACCIDGVHRPTVAGIHGHEMEGCYSLSLSGGYEDDLDYGVYFTYTGEGGRDLKGTKANPKNLRTAPQSKDQTLTRGNLALSQNTENNKPVRVIRGFKSKSPYAPEEGYRYDGLYSVAKYWKTRGLSGFLVYKFALKRCDGQAPPPWEQSPQVENSAVNTMGSNDC